MIKIEHAEQAKHRLSAHLKTTPLVRASGLSAWLKLETLQPTGSFKVRPAFNSILAQLDEARSRGVVASSSGNFAQAVAYAAGVLGVDATIVMPSSTSAYKIERTRALGAKVELSGPSFEERWELTHQLQAERGALLVHPYDSLETIAGDGTIALELLEQLSGDFTVVVPCSGGGMLAGIATVLKQLRPACKVIGVQPARNGAMAKSLERGSRVNVGKITSIADALVASEPGQNTFELARKHVDGLVLVEENELEPAVRWLATEQKLVVEAGGAAALAARLAGKLDSITGEIVFVLSGGNIAPEMLARILVG